MKINLGKSRKAVARAREAAILGEWPMSQQLEAMTEAAMGRPEKLDALNDFITGVKRRLPY